MCIFGQFPELVTYVGVISNGFESGVQALPSDEYYLRQAKVTAHMALTESDPVKAEALHVLALKYFDKAEKARTGRVTPAYQIPGLKKNRDLEK